MSEGKNAPGSLYVYHDEDGHAVAVSRWHQGRNGGISGHAVATMPVPSKHLSQDEVDRFAAHFAAAPEMLEALKKLTTEMIGIAGFAPEIRALVGNTNWAVLGQRVQEAHAAIARAEGRHP